LVTIFLSLSVLILGIIGCTSKAKPQEDNQDKEQSGRIVVPDNDWTEAEAGNNEETGPDNDGDSAGDASDGSGSDVDNGSGDPPDTEVIEPGTIDIQLYLNDVLQDEKFPIMVYNLTQTEVEIRFKASGSDLSYYEIQNAGPVNLPQQGNLEGLEASVIYKFTYNQTSWEDWGIIIFVRNTRGDTYTKNYKVQAIEVPGLPSQ